MRIVRPSDEAETIGRAREEVQPHDERTANYSCADFLTHAGVPPFIDAKHAIAHNKLMIIDGETVITGSFSFTKAAEESNGENLLVIVDRKLAAKYQANWQEHFRHSEAYAGR